MDYTEHVTYYDDEEELSCCFDPDTWEVVERLQRAVGRWVGLCQQDGELHAFFAITCYRTECRAVTGPLCTAMNEEQLRAMLRHETQFYEDAQAAVPSGSKVQHGSLLGWESRARPGMRGFVIFLEDKSSDAANRPRTYEAAESLEVSPALSAFESPDVQPRRVALFVDGEQRVHKLIFP